MRHSLRDLLAQRLYGLCCGYEDLNDHKALHGGGLMQTAVGRDEVLASAPTFIRLENRATHARARALHGQQELSQFHAYYDHHCHLPLYVFCGQAMRACVLRPSKIDGARHAAVEVAEACLADAYKSSGTKQRLTGEFSYAAKSWGHPRRVITRLEYGDQGTNCDSW